MNTHTRLEQHGVACCRNETGDLVEIRPPGSWGAASYLEATSFGTGKIRYGLAWCQLSSRLAVYLPSTCSTMWCEKFTIMSMRSDRNSLKSPV